MFIFYHVKLNIIEIVSLPITIYLILKIVNKSNGNIFNKGAMCVASLKGLTVLSPNGMSTAPLSIVVAFGRGMALLSLLGMN